MVNDFNDYHSRMKEAKTFTKFVIYLSAVAAQRGYRRYRDGVYEQHYTEEGFATCFWKKYNIKNLEVHIMIRRKRVHY